MPIGIVGTIWSYRSLRETGERHRTRIDWLGNITFTAGMAAVLVAITNGIQPYHGHATGWSNPEVLMTLAAGIVSLVAFCIIETRVADPMVRLGLFKIRAFAAGNVAALMVAMARGGLQFMLIIWLQGIWLPLHGYAFADTPLWAGIYLLPLTVGFLAAGPLCGHLADRYGARPFATGGMLLVAASFIGLYFLPVDFNYTVVRGPRGAQRHRAGHVLGAKHVGDHEQRARRRARRGVGDALDVPELRHGAVDRHLLLADDRRPCAVAAGAPDRRADRARRPGRRSPRRVATCRPSAHCSPRSWVPTPSPTCWRRPASWRRYRARPWRR